jgi:hypothetical protein
MNPLVRIRLDATPEQNARLAQLQSQFAEACNVLAPMVQRSRCWNRVALHHMAYRQLRQQFPQLGSQMVCNAIYSVSRSSRLIYQHPKSPFNVHRLGQQPLPCLRFLPQSPVYFDRHTLSVKDGKVSMFTLDGRVRFQLDLDADDEFRLMHGKLREISLTQQDGQFGLAFLFAASDDESGSEGEHDEPTNAAEFPEYLVVTEADVPTAPHVPSMNHAHPQP